MNNPKLRLAPLKNVDDLRERKPWSFKGSITSVGTTTEQLVTFTNFTNSVRLNSKITCFCEEPEYTLGKHDEEVNRIKGHLLPRMWTQYGDKHSGVCIIFDRQLLLQRFDHLAKQLIDIQGVRGTLHGRVKYTNDWSVNIQTNPVVGYETPDLQLQRNADQHFLTKHPDWSDEKRVPARRYV